MGPVSGVCGVWRRGRGSLLCVQESQQHVCDRDEAEGAGSAYHPSSICSRLVGRGRKGTNLMLSSDNIEMSGSLTLLTEGSQTCLADMSTSPLRLTLLIASVSHSTSCAQFVVFCWELSPFHRPHMATTSYMACPVSKVQISFSSLFFHGGRVSHFFFRFVLALQSLVRCKFRTTTTLVPIMCYHHRRHCVSPGLYRLFINVTF